MFDDRSLSYRGKEKSKMGAVTRIGTRRDQLARLVGVVVLAVAFVSFSVSSADAEVDYGFESVGASVSTLQAGAHPDLVTNIKFKGDFAAPAADVENLDVELPPGLVANPQNAPQCSFITFQESLGFSTHCSTETQVGVVEVEFGEVATPLIEPLYNLSTTNDEVARLGFFGIFYPIFIEVDLRSGSDYGVSVHSQAVENVMRIRSIRTEAWGVPADPIHDGERVTPLEAYLCGFNGIPGPCFIGGEGGPFTPGGKRASSLPPVPFVTNPTSCGPLNFGFQMTTYQHPGEVQRAEASAGNIVGCEKPPFEPSLGLAPTSHRAYAPTGLEAVLKMPQSEAVNTLNGAPLRGARVVLPEGLTVNSSAADGLEACSIAQAGYGTDNAAACPDASKLGTLEIDSPDLRRPVHGFIYLRTPEPGHLFRFWLVSNELGINLKLPSEVQLDPKTGRLTTVINDSPQLPAEEVVLRFNGGPRGALRNPPCGSWDASYELSPWSAGSPVSGTVPIVIDQGCGAADFRPRLSAGTLTPQAGSFAPFIFDIEREDAEENLAGLDVALPPGLVAKLAGIPICPEPQASSGSCLPASRIGTVKAAVGAGSRPLWIPQAGKAPTAVYLAGPYKGDPFSVVATVPAQAGPFDLGIVTVRSAIHIDPETSQVTVRSDPLPQILQGVPIDYRRVRLEVDREKFTINPTSCKVQEVRAVVRGANGDTAHPSDRFQSSGCGALAFSPRLALTLKGGTKRGAHPRLRAVLRANRGQANIRRVSVALPHSEFLEQAHIRTICTRVQFAADACPAGSVYGHASVTTPLLDKSLRGPVYLRSSSHDLPDLVVDLRGEIDITLSGRIDSVNGGIRTTFDAAPDAPFGKFVLNMNGGRKGLLVNSTNTCLRRHAATVQLVGHNGRAKNLHPVLKTDC
jgi:hypothetical protein